MRKIETIWHYLLNEALLKQSFRQTQQAVAGHFHYSLSTVHHALQVPLELGAIRKETKFFILEDFKKLLYYWASVRHLERDIVYQTFLDEPVAEVEGLAIPGSIFACYSAARHHLGESPADYAKVYWYLSDEKEMLARQRFPKQPLSGREANVFILRMPPLLSQYGDYTTLVQTFVDIWNLRDWYARDFYRSLEEKIDGLLS